MATSEGRNHPATPIDLSTLQQVLDEVFAALSRPSSNPPRRDDSSMCTQTDDDRVYTHTAMEMKVLLWNVHGSEMAEARRILVGEVVRRCIPDVLLLQEVRARDLFVRRITADCQPRSYTFHQSADSRSNNSEAWVGYDTDCFECVSRVDFLRIIGDTNLLSDRVVSLRSGENPSVDFYDSRSCAIRVRHRHTRGELVLMSFHNVNRGGRSVIVSKAQGFLRLVCMVHDFEGVPVIAGGDFNCDRSDLLACARDLQCELPDYIRSRRRMLCRKIDLYVLKSSTSINSTVEVYEALPLADPTSATAHVHPLGRESIRYLVENAPVRRDGQRFTRNDYTNTTNHDPTLNTVTVHYSEV